MTIYSSTNYRKIYEQHFGPIPKDENGRTYEIHHIDGNHSNNEPKNLIAVSIQEHYDIHFSQGDYGACYLIGVAMKLSPEKLSEIATKSNLRRVEEGTHPFMGGAIQRERVVNGTHHLLGGAIQRQTNYKQWKRLGKDHPLAISHRKSLAAGTHPCLTGESQRQTQVRLVENGTHHFLDKEWRAEEVKRRLATNTHNFQGPNSPTQLQWTCLHCGKAGKGKSNYNKNHGDKCKMKLK